MYVLVGQVQELARLWAGRGVGSTLGTEEGDTGKVRPVVRGCAAVAARA